MTRHSDQTTETYPGLLGWALTGEVGVSSRAIASYLALGKVASGFNSPADLGDFRRCEKLLRAAPTLRAEFPRMAEVSPVWARLVAAWDDIAATLEREVPGVYDMPRHSNWRAPEAGSKLRATLEDA